MAKKQKQETPAFAKIASDTTIKQWSVKDVEQIQFELCDFSPDQIGAMERLIRHPEDKVELSIAVKQKSLGIAAIKSMIKLKGCSLQPGGQKIEIGKFTSGERTEDLKALVQNATPVTITITQVQGAVPAATKPADDDEPLLGHQTEPRAERLEVTLPRAYGAKVAINLLQHDDGTWECVAAIQIPYADTVVRGELMEQDLGYNNRTDALEAIDVAIAQWVRRQEQYDRRLPLEQKVKAAIGKWIDAGETAPAATERGS